MFRRIASLTLAIVMVVLTVLTAGTPVSLAATYSGDGLVSPPPPAELQFAACDSKGSRVFKTPIVVDGLISQSIDHGSVLIGAKSTTEEKYVDSGAVFVPHLKLGDLIRAVITGTLGSDARVNIWIDDAQRDGKYFELGSDTTGAGDIYGSSSARADGGTMVIDHTTTFYMMNGPEKERGTQTFDFLEGKYGDREFALWIGVVGTTSGASLTLKSVNIVNKPDQVTVNPDWTSQDKVTGGLTPGVDAFATIQEAVEGVAYGGTITLAAESISTLSEQVMIDKSLTLNGNGATLEAVSDQVGASILVQNADNVTIEDLTLDGLSAGTPGDGDARFIGIYFRDASGAVVGNTVKGYQHAEGYHGDQSGIGIYAKTTTDAVKRTITIADNKVSDYQKGAIVVNCAGLTATIRKNEIKGWGETTEIAQNGIQIGYGATGVIEQNEIEGNAYTGPENKSYDGASILLYEPADGVVVRGNIIKRASDTVPKSAYGVSGCKVSKADIINNDFSGATRLAYASDDDPPSTIPLYDFTDCNFFDNILSSDSTSPWMTVSGFDATKHYAPGGKLTIGAQAGNMAAPFTVQVSVDGSDWDSLTPEITDDPVSLTLPATTGNAQIQVLGEVIGNWAGEDSVNWVGSTTGTFKIERPAEIWVDDDWASLKDEDVVTVPGGSARMGFDAFASLPAAVKVAGDGSTISVYPGDYPLVSDPSWFVDGQDDWYLAITQDNLTLRGVDASGEPIKTRPTATDPTTSPMPTVYGNDYTANGMFAVQSLVHVLGDNVTITGIAFMPKVEINKTVELVGANPTVKYCRFEPNTKISDEVLAELADPSLEDDALTKYVADYRAALAADGGTLYVNGSTVGTGESDVELTDNYFVKSCVCFDSVNNQAGTNRVADSVFDGTWSYMDGDTTVYGYVIGNVTWAKVQEFSGALVEDNTFLNIPDTKGYALILNRLDGQFTLQGNRMGGRDGADLIRIVTDAFTDPKSGGFTCLEGSVHIHSWINPGGREVDSNITVDVNGVHHGPVGPNNPPEPPVNPPVVPPVVAGSTSEAITTDGGTIQNGENLTVTFPSGALTNDVTVTVAPVVENAPPTEGMIAIGNHVYEITAETDAGDAVTQFGTDITISFTLTEEELQQAEATGATPMVFYWDEALGAWIPVPTELDGTTVIAHTNHLTTYAVMVKKDMPALTDIKGHWAEKHILKLVGLGVVGGQPDGTFAPSSDLTREQAAKMLALALGLTPETNATLGFADANSVSDWATGYIAAVAKAGYMTGLPGNLFDPQGKVTRAQFAAMVARALGTKAEAGDATTTFTDDQQIPSWAKAEVSKTVKAGIIGGLPGNVFAPGQVCTRAEAAKILSLMIGIVR